MNKTTTTTILLSALLLHSCQVFDAIAPADPITSFSIDVQDYGNVLVTDNSLNAEKVIIDWGDGETSNISSGGSLEHEYQANEEYEITVTSISKNAKKFDKLQKIVNVNTLHGSIIFYTRINYGKNVDVYIDDEYVGLTLIYFNDPITVPLCLVKGYDLKQGKHKIVIKIPSLDVTAYEGDVTIINKTCTPYEVK